MLMKPSITGNVVKDNIDLDTITAGQSLTGDISIKFLAGDVIPCNGSSNVYIGIKDSGDQVIQRSTLTLENFLTNSNANPKNCIDGQIFKDGSHDSPDWAWENPEQPGRAFSTLSEVTVSTPISAFSGLSALSAGTYTLEFILNYSADVLISDTKSFTVSAPVTTNPPTITDVSFTNLTGSNKFRVKDYVNCSSIVKDTDSSTVNVKYILWNETNFASPFKSGDVSCSGDSWVNGKSCNISVQITESHIDEWTCTISANDTIKGTYVNSSSIDMLNSPPILKDNFDNMSWRKNTNDSLELEDYFSEPDGQKLIYNFTGNNSISIFINSNDEAEFVPKANWTGTNLIRFSANDSLGLYVVGNLFLINITNSTSSCSETWNCTNWTSCVNNVRTRTCIDENNCGTLTGRPAINESCTGSTCGINDGCSISCVGGDSDCSCSLENGYVCGSNQTCSSSTLLHSGSGICCSISCTSTVLAGTTTNVNLGTNTNLENKSNKVLIGVSLISGIVFIMILVIIIYTYVQRKRAVVEESSPIVQPKEVAPQTFVKEIKQEPTIKVRPVNVEKMKEYIQKSLNAKVPLKNIKEELERAGWPQSDIEKELSLARLSNYIQVKINQGIPKEQIISSLRIKGWKEEQIKEALKETRIKPLF